jgi:broad specificity phosphatase PhoE
VERVDPCLRQILHDNPHRSVAIACHGGIIRVMLSILLEWPLSRMVHFNIEYGSVSVVELLPEKKHAVEIELLNCVPLRDGFRAGWTQISLPNDWRVPTQTQTTESPSRSQTAR